MLGVRLTEEERVMVAGWGLDLSRMEGWRECSCVEDASRRGNTSLAEKWRENEGPLVSAIMKVKVLATL